MDKKLTKLIENRLLRVILDQNGDIINNFSRASFHLPTRMDLVEGKPVWDRFYTNINPSKSSTEELAPLTDYLNSLSVTHENCSNTQDWFTIQLIRERDQNGQLLPIKFQSSLN